jgi:ribonuclease BN (tRNA processing enzyme)
MKLRVLGCSGSIAAGSRTTSFLLGQHVLVDAGTGVGDLTLAELAEIDHILITHSHLDHVLGIALLADSVMRLRTAAARGPIRVHALPETLQALRAHVFNGAIWPDFTRLPSAEAPILAFEAFAVGDVLELAGHRIEVLPASHTVPAVGFAFEGREGWIAYTGDTGPNPALWQRLSTLKLTDLIIETAFGDDERQLARISRHLCPTALGHELQNLRGPLNEQVAVHVTHIKPGEIAAVMKAITGIATPHRVRELSIGQEILLG